MKRKQCILRWMLGFLIIATPVYAKKKKVTQDFEGPILTYKEQIKKKYEIESKEKLKKPSTENLQKKSIEQQKQILKELKDQTQLLREIASLLKDN